MEETNGLRSGKLVLLAKLCGKVGIAIVDDTVMVDGNDGTCLCAVPEPWQPHLDANQAIEVLIAVAASEFLWCFTVNAALGDDEGDGVGFEAEITHRGTHDIVAMGYGNFCLAVCRAALKAAGSTEAPA